MAGGEYTGWMRTRQTETELYLPATPDLSFESGLWQRGILRIAGIDEAGRGALAGPVAAGAVILPADSAISARLKGVRDSKEMTAEARKIWALEIRRYALAWGIGYASAREIDQIGILPATRLAAQRAMRQLSPIPEYILSDYLRLPQVRIKVEPLVKGDRRCLSIAAASVLAKTARDAIMVTLDKRYPGYGFAHHKGYGTRAHRLALMELGPCRTHRRSFNWKRVGIEGAENEV